MAQTPQGFIPDTPSDKPPGFVPDGFVPDNSNDLQGSVGHAPKTQAPSMLDDIGSSVAELAGGVGRGLKSVASLPSTVYHAVADPLTDEEKSSGLYPDRALQDAGKATGLTLGMTPSGVLQKAYSRLTSGPVVHNYRALTDGEKKDAPTNLGLVLGLVPVYGTAAQDVVNEYRDKGLNAALGKTGVYIFLPQVAKEAGHMFSDKALDPLKAEVRGATQLTPQTLITKALNPSDINFQRHVDTGLSELKAGQRELGRPIKGVEDSLAGLALQRTKNSKGVDSLVKPQATMTYPGSAKIMADKQVAAIPETFRLHDPEGYALEVKRIRSAHPDDYKLGELNSIRSEAGSQKTPFYSKNTSGQLTAEAGNQATDIARGTTARALLYKGMDEYGLGGGAEAAELNRRIGAGIHLEDALKKNRNASVKEMKPTISKALDRIKNPLSTTGVDDQLALAVQRWRRLPEPVSTKIEPRVAGTKGAQMDLIPMDTPYSNQLLNEPYSDAMNRMLYGKMEDGDLMTPEDVYLEHKRQKQIWTDARPKLPKGQMDIQNGLAHSMFGLEQTAEGVGGIPSGSKLAFTSKGMFGEMFHYETPDGKIITVDHEIPPSVLRDKPKTPYTPGTSTSKTILSPPPPRTK